MAEPTSSIALMAATAAGLTIFGVATGLHPAILLAGLAGGLWALSYHPPMPIWKRCAVTVIAAVVAGYMTPIAAAAVASIDMVANFATIDMVQLPIAVLIGLLAHKVLGPAFLRIAAKKAEEVAK